MKVLIIVLFGFFLFGFFNPQSEVCKINAKDKLELEQLLNTRGQ